MEEEPAIRAQTSRRRVRMRGKVANEDDGRRGRREVLQKSGKLSEISVREERGEITKMMWMMIFTKKLLQTDVNGDLVAGGGHLAR